MLTQTGLRIHGMPGYCVVLDPWWLQRRKDKVQDMKCFSDGRTETGWGFCVFGAGRGERGESAWRLEQGSFGVCVLALWYRQNHTGQHFSRIDPSLHHRWAWEQIEGSKWAAGGVALSVRDNPFAVLPHARLAPHHGHGFPFKWSSLFSPQILYP